MLDDQHLLAEPAEARSLEGQNLGTNGDLLRALLHASELLATACSLSELQASLAAVILEFPHVARLKVYVVQEGGNGLSQCCSVSSISNGAASTTAESTELGLIELCRQDMQSHFHVSEVAAQTHSSSAEEHQARSAAFPLIVSGGLVGIMWLQSAEGYTCSEAMDGALAILASQIAGLLTALKPIGSSGTRNLSPALALSVAGDGIWDWDVPTGRILRSKQLKAMLGYSEDEIGDTFTEWERLVHPHDFEAAYSTINEHHEGIAESYSAEYRLKCKDGSYKWILDRGRVVSRDESGKPLRMVGTHTEISGMKRLQRELEEVLEWHEQAEEDGGIGTWDWDPVNNTASWSRHCYRLLGYEPFSVQASMETARKHIHAEDLPEVERFFANLITKRSPDRLQNIHRVTTPDGNTRWIQLCAMVNRAARKETRVHGIAQDVTDRVLVEQALRESRSQLRAIIDNEPECVKVLDTHGCLLDMNPAGLSMIDADSLDCVLHLPVNQLVCDEDRPNFDAMTSSVLQGHPERLRFKISGLRGTKKTLESVSVPIWNDDHSAVQQILSVTRDVTEMELAEAQLRESEARHRAIISASPVPMALNDSQGRVTYLNEAFLRTFGYTLQDIPTLADWWPKAYPNPEYAAWVESTWKAELAEARRTGAQFRPVELNITCKDGQRRTVLASASSIEGKFDKEHLVALFDITEPKRATSLLEARIRLSSFAESHSVHDLLQATLDECERLTDSLIGFYHHVDESEQTLILQAWSTRTTAEFCRAEALGMRYEVSRAGVWIDALRQRKSVIHNDYSKLDHRRGLPEGHAQVLRELVVPVFRNGQVVALLGVGNKATEYGQDDVELVEQLADMAWDIAERRHSETALQESEERLRLALHGSGQGLFDLNLETGRAEVTPEYMQMLGYDADEFAIDIETWRSLIHPEDRERIEHVLAECASGRREVYSMDYRLRAKDGHWRWISSTGQASAKLPGGKVTRLLGVHADITERKLVEQMLQQHETRYQCLINTSKDGFWVVDTDGFVLEVNDAYCLMSGYTREQIVGQHLSFFDCSESSEEMRLHIEQILRDGSARFQVKHRAADGRVMDIEVNTVVIGPERIQIAFLTDITARKRAEHDLREAARYTRDLIEASLDPLVTISPDGKVTDVNRATESITGHSRRSLVGSDFSSYFTDPEMAKDAYQTVFTTGYVRDFPLTIQHASGGRTDVLYNATVYRNETGEVQGVFAAARDVTERKRAEEQLHASEEQLRNLLQSVSHIAVQGYSPDGTVRLWNKASERLYGYSEEEAVGKNLLDLIALPHMREAMQADIQQMIDTGLGWPAVELSLKRKDGSVVHVYTNRNIVKTQLLGQQLFSLDIDLTERDQAAEERHRLELQVQHSQKLESLGVLAGGIAHDFNNILVGILGNAGLALMETKPGTRPHELAHDIETAAKRAADLTRQMLAYSGRGQIVTEPVDLNSIVSETSHLLHSVISKRALLLSELAEDLPSIEADASQLRQIVMNLITNASDALSEADGVITLRTSHVSFESSSGEAGAGEEVIRPGDYVCLEVSDTGAGIPPSSIRRIFEPFYTTKFAGRGLGLAVVQGIVRGHHGAIRVQSTPGQGTTFRIYLPASQLPTRKAVVDVLADTASLRGLGRVLLVDDEATVRLVARAILHKAGLEVDEAENGLEALKLMDAHHGSYVCVVTDLTMPLMGGDELVAKLGERGESVPVILMSGFTELNNPASATGLNSSLFLKKPFTPDDLTMAVASCIAHTPNSETLCAAE